MLLILKNNAEIIVYECLHYKSNEEYVLEV